MRNDDSYNLRKIFEQIELDLVKSMRRTLKLHEAEEKKEGFKWEQWQSAKLRNLWRYRKENGQIVSDRTKEIENIVNKSIQGSYKDGQNLFSKIVNRISSKFARKNMFASPKDADAGQENTTFEDKVEKKENDFFHMNDQKIEALQETVNNDLKKAQSAVLRKMDDVYRQTIYKAEMHMTAGAKTLDQAIDMATKEFLAAGINCIEYKDGKRVNIASYAEMALRTASHRATLLGEGKMRDEWGIHTVVVSAHANTCTHCEKWQGMVLVDDVFCSGTMEEALESKYYLLSFAIAAGLLHPNCRHSISTFFPGISELPMVPDGKEAVKKYEAEQEQRRLERLIRKWKRIAEGSLDPDKVKDANDKVREYQNELREHLKKYPYLRRDYSREKTRDILDTSDSLRKTNQEFLDKYNEVRYNKDGTVKVTDDWKAREHPKIPKQYKANAIIETKAKSGQVDRTLYDKNGMMSVQVHSGNHENAKQHPYGLDGEHYHAYTWSADGKRIAKTTEELTDKFRIEHADILGG